jgi:deoxyribodipyrimidine photo-lyase
MNKGQIRLDGVGAAPFPATRAAGLERLARFAPVAGRQYAAGRNSDLGPDGASAVSRLSPYVRYRMVGEQEILASVLAQHNLAAAEKYVQEVLWRTYWKGWLEQRPEVWSRYLEERQREALGDTGALADAENGTTGIEGFDDWARELRSTGYLHNHARMWFASIWIFTLRLPWALGADFFLRHLIDADAASNTLSWRWVAGLQTAGKTYLATADNIARYTGGRFAPAGLARQAIALTEPPIDGRRVLPYFAPEGTASAASDPALLLVTHEDLHPESLWPERDAIKSVVMACDPNVLWGANAQCFVAAAMTDAALRVGAHFRCGVDRLDTFDAQRLIAIARGAGVRRIVTAHAPVGPVADALARLERDLALEGIDLSRRHRAWDARFWPHATKGFFPFKARIPALLQELGLL